MSAARSDGKTASAPKSSPYRLPVSDARTSNRAESEALLAKLLEWAKEDPLGALRFAQNEIKPYLESQNVILDILKQWATSDPELAWEWAEQQTPSHLVNLVGTIAKIDAALGWEKAQIAATKNPDDLFRSYANAIEGTVHDGDYSLALELLQNAEIPQTATTPDGKFSLLDDLFGDWALYSPEDAAAWIAANPEADDSALKSLANQALIKSWTYTDPLATMDYALTLSQDTPKRYAIGASFRHLAATDLEQASDWLETHADDTGWYDPLVFDFATDIQMSSDNIESAITWAGNIVDEDIQFDALVEIAAGLIKLDPENAQSYFSGDPLFDDVVWEQANLYAAERANTQDFTSPHEILFSDQEQDSQ